MSHRFEIYKDKAGEFRARFMYNSEVMFSTEGYSSKANAVKAINSIKRNGPSAPVEDNTGTAPRVQPAAAPPAESPAFRAQRVVELERAVAAYCSKVITSTLHVVSYRPEEEDWPIFLDLMMGQALIATLEVYPNTVITTYPSGLQSFTEIDE